MVVLRQLVTAGVRERNNVSNRGNWLNRKVFTIRNRPFKNSAVKLIEFGLDQFIEASKISYNS